MRTPQTFIAAVSEKDLQATILQAARLYGWWCFHPYDSRRSTPGWPDLVLLRPPELLFVELKTERGRVSDDQARVLEALTACGVEVHVWRPSDEDTALARLRRGAR